MMPDFVHRARLGGHEGKLTGSAGTLTAGQERAVAVDSKIVGSPFLDPSLAATFVQRLGEHIPHNINIMDKEGIIIASREAGRIGTFHEAAHRLVQASLAVKSIAPDEVIPPGVKPGVNLPIVYRGETIGVVGVTGDPREVATLAYAVKTSVETMIEHELYKEQMIRRQNKKNLFLNYLLHQDEAPLALIESLGVRLGYDPHLLRAPILMRFSEGTGATEVLAALKQKGLHTPQDISYVIPDGRLLVFKRIGVADVQIMQRYRDEVRKYAKAALACPTPRNQPSSFPAYASGFQKDFDHYQGAYRQVLWLSERFPHNLSDDPVFFMDHIHEYFVSRLPRSDLIDAFDSIVRLVPVDFADDLYESIRALCQSAFNEKEAAARLGIHRNTLLARLNRLNELLGIELRNDAHARDFLSYLARYLELPGARQGAS